MKWQGRRQSDNVEDRRGGAGGKIALGGGLGTIAIVVIMLLLGGDPSQVMQQVLPSQTETSSGEVQETEQEKELADFVKVVLADTEDVWGKLFSENGSTYRAPKLVLFRNSVETGCGNASSSMGPFYCSADEKAYIDLSFYEDMKNRFGAPGDFAMAYVIAHEIGHHVQNLMGISDKVHAQRSRLSETEFNKLSVKMELQADFFAGVWAHHAQKMSDILENGDIEEALNAANAIGDDRLQKQAQGYIVPDAFTHGTSEQRMFWFKKGFQTGDLQQGDTFSAREL
jgi:hypothetical protein